MYGESVLLPHPLSPKSTSLALSSVPPSVHLDFNDTTNTKHSYAIFIAGFGSATDYNT